MSKDRNWLNTPAGRVVRFLGGLKLAIPVMALVAVALMWGTWIESSKNAELAKQIVYGSWWFIGLMIWMCISLIFAVISRYPWRKRHIGFIVVHAGIVTIIIGGFISLYTKVEGSITLQEGTSTDVVELRQEQVQWIPDPHGERVIKQAANVGHGIKTFRLGDKQFRVLDRWPNCTQEMVVDDNGAEPFHAVEIAMSPEAEKGSWLGQTASDAQATTMGDLLLRVLPMGEKFKPANNTGEAGDTGDAVSGEYFTLNGKKFPLPAEGETVFPGWTVESIHRFQHAQVGENGLTESPGSPLNPATEVIITDGLGTRERHIIFKNFPEMVMGRPIEGDKVSGAELHVGKGNKSPHAKMRRLVFEPLKNGLRVVLERPDGSINEQVFTGDPPYEVKAGKMSFYILKDYHHAQSSARLVKAPAQDGNMPVLVIQPVDGGDEIQLPWKNEVHAEALGLKGVLRYAPASEPIPFRLKLEDFRQTNYPGSDMAMAYESDVSFDDGKGWTKQRIWMNNPLKLDGWKVYQSGFMGDDISVFSVAKDPGLPLTYLGCILLCLGIILIFYSRGYSTGHPGVPKLGTGRKGEA